MLLYGQENQQNCYIARLVVRREVKLTSLGRTQPIFRCALSRLTWMGTTKKWTGTSKKFRPALCAGILCPSTFKLFPAPLGATQYYCDFVFLFHCNSVRIFIAFQTERYIDRKSQIFIPRISQQYLVWEKVVRLPHIKWKKFVMFRRFGTVRA